MSILETKIRGKNAEEKSEDYCFWSSMWTQQVLCEFGSNFYWGCKSREAFWKKNTLVEPSDA